MLPAEGGRGRQDGDELRRDLLYVVRRKKDVRQNSINAFDAEPATDIGCDAEGCAYNNRGECEAVTVSITGRKATKCYDTECDSFRLRR